MRGIFFATMKTRTKLPFSGTRGGPEAADEVEEEEEEEEPEVVNFCPLPLYEGQAPGGCANFW